MGIIHSTMKEWGAKLPIGIYNKDTGKLEKEFKLRPYLTKFDRLLGLWRQANKKTYDEGAMIPADVAKLMSILIAEVGSTSYSLSDSGDSPNETLLDIMQWHYSDVLYAYMYARVEELGPEWVSPVSCPHLGCGWKTSEGVFDISEVDVVAAEDVEDLTEWVDLKRPFLLRDGNTRLESVKVRPAKWATMTKPGMIDGNLEQIGYYTLQDSIHAINRKDTPYILSEGEIDQIRKIDRVNIDNAAGRVTGGVSLGVTLTCPNCQGEIVNPLNWERQDFFGGSSPSGN